MTDTHHADVPVYLRLRTLIVDAILDGLYAEGDQLPSVRAFATTHGANPLTVAKAYQSLQDEGYVFVRRGIGMFVADGAWQKLCAEERRRFCEELWPRIHARMERLGLDPHDLPGMERA